MSLIERVKQYMDPDTVIEVLDIPTDRLVDALIEEILEEAEAFELYLEEIE